MKEVDKITHMEKERWLYHCFPVYLIWGSLEISLIVPLRSTFFNLQSLISTFQFTTYLPTNMHNRDKPKIYV